MMQIFRRGMIVAVVAFSQVAALNPQWGAVLPDDQALTFARPRLCNRPAPGPADGTWTPDTDTIRKLESVLGTELQAAITLSSEQERSRPASDYYRQYAPLVIAGKRIVYVNGLHRSTIERNPKLSWKTTASLACDGGILFFGAEYDVERAKLSKIIFNGGGRGRSPADRSGTLPPDLAKLIEDASLNGPVHSFCPAADGFAVATVSAGEPRYVVLYRDGRVQKLSAFKGQSDLKCYNRREADKLAESLKSSETIEGSLTPRWDTIVVCGFVEETMAVCWQYSPTEGVFVGVGGWIT